ncbi:MAG: adenylate/guanylate cyclase domain-containing protein [Alphaproteobacteria bacterium]|nr:adenylate/guanylate cyclase domain-containing protein [Alphaproteobacteria bacterium]
MSKEAPKENARPVASRFRRIFAALVILSISCSISVYLVRSVGSIKSIEYWTRDIRDILLSPWEKVRDDIVIFGITEETLNALPYRSPVDRGFLADLLNHIAKQNPRAVALDILFDRPTEPEKDAAFLKALQDFPAPVFVSYGDVSDSITQTQFDYMGRYLKDVGKGYANLLFDTNDATVRWINTRHEAGESEHMGLSAEVASVLGATIPESSIPLDYLVGPDLETSAFKIIPAHIAPMMPKQFLNLENKIVMIGGVLRETDRYRTPFASALQFSGQSFKKEAKGKTVQTEGAAGVIPGLLIHAHALAQLLDGRRMVILPLPWEIAITALIALAGLLSARLTISLWIILSIATAAFLLYLGVVAGFFIYGNIMAPVIAPSLGFFASFGLTSIYQRRMFQEERAFIRGALSRYVAEDVVKQLEDEPWRLKLGGERRNLTFLFTDIADFTSLSERTEPEVLVPALNDYLNRASQIVLDHEGVIDKFIGDAIVVVFGAFNEDADHPQQAVDCAMALDVFAHGFVKEQAAKGMDFGRTRIGVNTGTAIIGNFGGDLRFDFTSIGDAVNTAARLEGANKYFGTCLCVSGSAADACSDTTFRPIGEAVLKGKEDGIAVFEPVTPENPNGYLISDYADAFVKMKNREPDALQSFQELLKKAPNDPLAAFHLDRLKSGMTGSRIVFDEK